MDEYKFYGYIDDKSILVITSKNKAVRIWCPFIVVDRSNVKLQVDRVTESNSILYYSISGKFQNHSKYEIVLEMG